MRDALDRVLDRVRKVVQRVDAPFVALAMMMRAYNAVDRRIAHVHVRAGHIDLGAQSLGAVRKFAVAHVLEQLQVFRNRAVAVRAFLARYRQRTAVLAQLLLRQIVHICLAILDELHSAFIAGLKVVRAVEYAARRLLAGQPVDILPDGVYILGILFDRIGVVIPEVELAAVFLRDRPVDEDRLRRADVQIAVRLGRESGMNFFRQACRNILVNDLCQKVIYIFHHSLYSPKLD